MDEKLYHSEIGLPYGFVAPQQRVTINYGAHAKREALEDKYGTINLPETLPLSRFRVIEVGMRGGKVSKILFRAGMDEKRDLCIVLIPNGTGPWTCKTLWVNLKTDSHKTLDRSRYVR